MRKPRPDEKDPSTDSRLVEDILLAALEEPPGEREAYIGSASRGDDRLRNHLRALLEAGEEAAARGFLDRNAADLLDTAFRNEPERSGDLGAYRIIRELGRGGVGVVYLADRADGEFRHQVAIKVLRRELSASSLAGHFNRERQILAQLEHPNVARLLGGGSDEDGRAYFILEYVEGEPIDRYCDAHGLTIVQRLRLFLQACAAVQFAHENAVVHGDLKPRNLLVRTDGTVKLLDFGTARILASPAVDVEPKLAEGSRALTLSYASPEQLDGALPSALSDVFSLGALLHALLVGVTPRTPGECEKLAFQREPKASAPSGTFSTLRRLGKQGSQVSADDIARRRGLSCQALERHLRGDLDAIVARALEPDPHRRYRSVEQLTQDIRAFLEARPVSARHPTVFYRSLRFVRRNPVVTLLSLALVLFLAGSSAALWLQARRLRAETELATEERARAEQLSSFLVGIFEFAGAGAQVPTADLLQQGTARARGVFARQPAELATALTALGAAYKNMALYIESEALLQEGLDLRLREVGADHPDTASSWLELGRLAAHRADLDGAESLIRSAQRIRERHFGSDSAEFAETLSSLSAVEVMQGSLLQAEESARNAWEIQKRVLGPEDERTLRSQSNLAFIQLSRGTTDGLEETMLAVLDAQKRLRGPSHPEVGVSLAILGALYENLNRLAEAEVMLGDAVDILHKTWGPRHPQVAMSLLHLARVHRAQAEYGIAEPLARKAAAILTEIHGPDHPYPAVAWHELGLIELGRGGLDAAVSAFERSIELTRTAASPVHEYGICGLGHLGEIAHRRGSLEEAERLLDQSLTMWRDSSGLASRYAAATLRAKGLLLLDLGSAEQGRALLERSLEVRSSVLRSDHPEVAESMLDLAALELESGNLVRSNQLCAEALAIRRRSFGASHPATTAAASFCRQGS